MTLIPLIIENIIPLYILVILGFIAGRVLDVNLPSIAKLLIYILSPMVAFGAITNIQFNAAYILLPIGMFAISILITTFSYQTSKRIWHDGTANLIGGASVNGNAVFFGLSIIIALFDPAGAGIYLLMNLGPMINNFVLSYYLTARGRFSVRESLMKLARHPVIYAFAMGFIFNFAQISLPETVMTYWKYTSGCVIILGMMMIGIALSKLDRLELDWRLLLSLIGVKFILWPAFVFSWIVLDIHYFGLYGDEVHMMMAMFSAMPIIANLVAYAAEHNLHPERAASVVLISTVMGIISVPVAYLAVTHLIS